MTDQERRETHRPGLDILKSELNADQRETVDELEKFGWELRFIRHEPEQAPVPVIFASNNRRFAVLDEDGILDEAAFLKLRG